MRVDHINKINSVYKSQSTKAVKGSTYNSEKDSFDISRMGKDMTVATKAVNQVPDIRMDKVNVIKAQIESGTYNVGAEEVASKLVDAYFDAKI